MFKRPDNIKYAKGWLGLYQTAGNERTLPVVALLYWEKGTERGPAHLRYCMGLRSYHFVDDALEAWRMLCAGVDADVVVNTVHGPISNDKGDTSPPRRVKRARRRLPEHQALSWL